jgi:hypothetical protein
MAEIINFNKARKKKAKLDAEQRAAENRVRFGRSKAEKQLDAARSEAERQRLDQLQREAPLKDPGAPGADDAD